MNRTKIRVKTEPGLTATAPVKPTTHSISSVLVKSTAHSISSINEPPRCPPALESVAPNPSSLSKINPPPLTTSTTSQSANNKSTDVAKTRKSISSTNTSTSTTAQPTNKVTDVASTRKSVSSTDTSKTSTDQSKLTPTKRLSSVHPFGSKFGPSTQTKSQTTSQSSKQPTVTKKETASKPAARSASNNAKSSTSTKQSQKLVIDSDTETENESSTPRRTRPRSNSDSSSDNSASSSSRPRRSLISTQLDLRYEDEFVDSRNKGKKRSREEEEEEANKQPSKHNGGLWTVKRSISDTLREQSQSPSDAVEPESEMVDIKEWTPIEAKQIKRLQKEVLEYVPDACINQTNVHRLMDITDEQMKESPEECKRNIKRLIPYAVNQKIHSLFGKTWFNGFVIAIARTEDLINVWKDDPLFNNPRRFTDWAPVNGVRITVNQFKIPTQLPAHQVFAYHIKWTGSKQASPCWCVEPAIKPGFRPGTKSLSPAQLFAVLGRPAPSSDELKGVLKIDKTLLRAPESWEFETVNQWLADNEGTECVEEASDCEDRIKDSGDDSDDASDEDSLLGAKRKCSGRSESPVEEKQSNNRKAKVIVKKESTTARPMPPPVSHPLPPTLSEWREGQVSLSLCLLQKLDVAGVDPHEILSWTLAAHTGGIQGLKHAINQSISMPYSKMDNLISSGSDTNLFYLSSCRNCHLESYLLSCCHRCFSDQVDSSQHAANKNKILAAAFTTSVLSG